MRWARMMLLTQGPAATSGFKMPVAPQGKSIKVPDWSNKDSHYINLEPHSNMDLEVMRPVIAQRFQLAPDLVVYDDDGNAIDEIQEGSKYYVAGFLDWGRGCPRVTLGQVDFFEGK